MRRDSHHVEAERKGHVRTQQEGSHEKPRRQALGETKPASTSILDSSLQSCGKINICYLSHPVHGTFWEQPEPTNAHSREMGWPMAKTQASTYLNTALSLPHLEKRSQRDLQDGGGTCLGAKQKHTSLGWLCDVTWSGNDSMESRLSTGVVEVGGKGYELHRGYGDNHTLPKAQGREDEDNEPVQTSGCNSSTLELRALLLFSLWVVLDSPWLHNRLPCPSPSPGVCPNACLLNQWCYITISSSAAPSPLILNLSQWAGFLHQVAKVLEIPDALFQQLFIFTLPLSSVRSRAGQFISPPLLAFAPFGG